jgi:hypothetical protein
VHQPPIEDINSQVTEEDEDYTSSSTFKNENSLEKNPFDAYSQNMNPPEPISNK